MRILEKGILTILLIIQLTFCKNCFFYIPSTNSIYYLKNIVKNNKEHSIEYQIKNEQIIQKGFLIINFCGQVETQQQMFCSNSSVLFMSKDKKICVNMMTSNQNKYLVKNLTNEPPYEGFQIQQPGNQFKTIIRCIKDPEEIDPQFSLDENQNLVIETVDACAYENYIIYFFTKHKNFVCFFFMFLGLYFLFNNFKKFKNFICIIQLLLGFSLAFIILYFTISYKKTIICFITVFLFCLLVGLSNSLMFYYMCPLSNVFTFSMTFFIACFYIQRIILKDNTIFELIILTVASLLVGLCCRKGHKVLKFICQCFLCSFMIVYSFINWIEIDILNESIFSSNFLLTHISLILLILSGYIHQKDKLKKPTFSAMTTKEFNSSLLLSLDQLIYGLIMNKRQKKPLEIILNDMMEFLSKIMLVVLIFVLIIFEKELRIIVIENDSYIFNFQDVVIAVLGYVYSHLCLLISKNLIRYFKNHLVNQSVDAFVRKEQIKRCTNYLCGILYYGSYTAFLFKYFYKTDNCPELFGGYLNLEYYSFNRPVRISTIEKIFYLVHSGHHVERLVDYVKNYKDQSSFYTMFYHHVLTPILLVLSLIMGYHKWGFGVFFLFDMTEVFLNASRLFKETKALKGIPLNIVFLLFLLTWTYNRVYGFYIVAYRWSLRYYFSQQQIDFIHSLLYTQ